MSKVLDKFKKFRAKEIMDGEAFTNNSYKIIDDENTYIYFSEDKQFNLRIPKDGSDMVITLPNGLRIFATDVDLVIPKNNATYSSRIDVWYNNDVVATLKRD